MMCLEERYVAYALNNYAVITQKSWSSSSEKLSLSSLSWNFLTTLSAFTLTNFFSLWLESFFAFSSCSFSSWCFWLPTSLSWIRAELQVFRCARRLCRSRPAWSIPRGFSGRLHARLAWSCCFAAFRRSDTRRICSLGRFRDVPSRSLLTSVDTYI